MDPARQDEYLLSSEAAELLGGVSPKTISRWAKEGKLPYVRTLGGHRRYPAAALRDLAATLGYHPEPDDASDGLDAPAEGDVMGGFLADPGDPPPDPRL
jgi:excisionase family DNA binding protein